MFIEYSLNHKKGIALRNIFCLNEKFKKRKKVETELVIKYSVLDPKLFNGEMFFFNLI